MTDNITENFVTVYLPLLKSICGKNQLESGIWMDGWIKLPKKKAKTIFTYEVQSIITVYP